MIIHNFLVIAGAIVVCGQLYEGDRCRDTTTNKWGICKPLRQCQDAMEKIKKRIYPTTCSFQQSEIVICCLGQDEKKSRIPGEKSREMCQNYSQYVWKVEPSPTLLVVVDDIYTNDCPFKHLLLVVGGTLASRKEFPHMAQIGFSNNPISWGCGGTLISDEWVLTAGHCLEDRSLGPALHARMGFTDLDDLEQMQQFNIIQKIAYPEYTVSTNYHDIGLVKLDRKAKLNTWTRPACLYTSKSSPWTKAIATGWGKVEFGGSESRELRKVTLELYNDTFCGKVYRRESASTRLKEGIKDDLMICAGDSEELKDTCQGDSGGPLQVYSDSSQPNMTCMYDILGVTSFGKACGLQVNIPGVYTRVSNYLKWIEDIVWPQLNNKFNCDRAYAEMTKCWVMVLMLLGVKFADYRISSLRIAQPTCLLNDNIGRCVDAPSCPMGPSALVASVNASQKLCDNGKVCCIVSAKIVTPDNSPAQPIGVAPTTGGVALVEPTFIAGGVLPQNSASTGTVSLLTPIMMSNIVADPNFHHYPPETSDSVVVSAEVVNSAAEIFDRKCDLYYSMLQSKIVQTGTQQDNLGFPVVMIFGGVDTGDMEFPHMAALGFGRRNSITFLCGGSLITESFILSAAHCLRSPYLGEVQYAKLGSIYLSPEGPNVQLLNIVNRIPHTQYDSRTQYNDIALLQLAHPVSVNSYVAPICLFSSTNYEDKNLIATGWGKTESFSSSVTLQKVALEMFSEQECQRAYSQVSHQQLPLGIQTAIQMCAGSHQHGKDTCQGDSGGPLQIRKNNRWYLVGITSIGLQCGQANVPGVYTRVASYLQWIEQNINNK
ncbi:transmembrane protease serine 9-like [Euwallacea fornicatus]|uniref:transmembrane protease serine 9-like n=1 Tax=Euwallacea fornicatus TaxID=995702 RepID=UPI00338FEEAD